MACPKWVEQYRLLGFGEAMIRFAPTPAASDMPGRETFLRSIGGDELNVCVDMATLDQTQPSNTTPQWISVLPEGPMGDLVVKQAQDVQVDVTHCPRIPNTDVGIFTVLPELKMVHYQRRNSAFSQHTPSIFDWKKILTLSEGVKPWLHMTGITPMIEEMPRTSWCLAMDAAIEAGVPISMDFNHRPQLGSLDSLWAIVEPYISKLELIIFSVGQLRDLAKMTGASDLIPGDDVSMQDESWRILMTGMRKKWNVKRLAVCFKSRDSDGLQRRWSAIADEAGTHTTVNTPIFHKPKDECGGGSAWATGIIDRFWRLGGTLDDGKTSASATIHSSSTVDSLRQADLLAAMCQESVGDMSTVTREQLESQLAKGVNAQGELIEIDLEAVSKCAVTDATLETLKQSGILAIIRAKNADAAIERGVELVEMGAKAIEVTLDTTDWRRVLKELVARSPPSTCIGVGTVMDDTVECLKEVKALGGKFALSPINPIGLIKECERLDMLAVPSGLSSNEMWDLKRKGAKMIKMFHAGQVTAPILKSMMGVTPLKAMNIMPSGGVSPNNAEEWLDAGSAVVGMGSNLVGKELSHPTGSEAFIQAQKDWAANGKAEAQKLFDMIDARFGPKV